jgi:hypothetical protein
MGKACITNLGGGGVERLCDWGEGQKERDH